MDGSSRSSGTGGGCREQQQQQQQRPQLSRDMRIVLAEFLFVDARLLSSVADAAVYEYEVACSEAEEREVVRE